jgi:hypothetical protein
MCRRLRSSQPRLLCTIEYRADGDSARTISRLVALDLGLAGFAHHYDVVVVQGLSAALLSGINNPGAAIFRPLDEAKANRRLLRERPIRREDLVSGVRIQADVAPAGRDRGGGPTGWTAG